MEYIRSDLDRNGKVKIKEDGSLTFHVFCAYFIFCRQKELLKNSDEILKISPMYDQSLIQTESDLTLEPEQLRRLFDIRNAAKEHLGEEYFSELISYVQGAHNKNFTGIFSELTSDEKKLRDEFEHSLVSNKIFKLIKGLSITKQGVILVLLDYFNYKSILLPIGLVEKWISVPVFIQSAMALPDFIWNLSGTEEEVAEREQDLYSYFQNVAFQSLNYLANAETSLPEELTLEESISHEYKASFRTPYPKYPDTEVDKNGQNFLTIGNEKLKSKKDVHKFIETQSLKTIVAFLNTNGGTLVIGVHEKDNKKKVVGINREGFESNDKYELHISQIIQNRIGTKFIGEYINVEMKPINDDFYCLITVKEYIPSSNQIPAYLDQEKCYRRTGPRSDEIQPGPELATFAVERQNSSR